jgi:hypothetical protein
MNHHKTRWRLEDWASEDTLVKLVEVARWLIDEHLAHLRGAKSQPGERVSEDRALSLNTPMNWRWLSVGMRKVPSELG